MQSLKVRRMRTLNPDQTRSRRAKRLAQSRRVQRWLKACEFRTAVR